ncbi:hypothetical protein EV368DRAFT_70463, partial [Lentinula lateritia]
SNNLHRKLRVQNNSNRLPQVPQEKEALTISEIDETALPWLNQASSSLRVNLSESLEKTCVILANLAQSTVQSQPDCPIFSNEDWDDIITGKPAQFDHIFSLMHAATLDERQTQKVGEVEFKFGPPVAGKQVSNSALPEVNHYKVINYNKAIRYRVSRSRQTYSCTGSKLLLPKVKIQGKKRLNHEDANLVKDTNIFVQNATGMTTLTKIAQTERWSRHPHYAWAFMWDSVKNPTEKMSVAESSIYMTPLPKPPANVVLDKIALDTVSNKGFGLEHPAINQIPL